MADGVEFSITGLDSLLGKLDAVSYDIRRRGGRAALRKAAQVVVQKGKAGAERIDDKATGRSIADNIVLRWNGRLFKRTGDLGFRIGVLHGAVLKNGGDLSQNAPPLTGDCLSSVPRRWLQCRSCGRPWPTASAR